MTLCDKCGGVGKTTYHKRGPGWSETGSRLCECRRVLPPREGRAQWWDTERIFEQRVSIGPDRHMDIVIDRELPVSEDSYRVVMRGNRYFPTAITLNGKTLIADDARALAVALIEAADKCDASDQPDTDLCGHWAPCDCNTAKAAQ